MDARALAIALVLTAAAVAIGVLAHVHPAFPGDEAVSAWARALGPGFAPVARVFNIYYLHWAIPLGLVAAAILIRKGDDEAVGVILVVVLLRPVMRGLRFVVDRPRPTGDFPILQAVEPPAFPSGHVLTVAVAAGMWIVFARRLAGERLAPAVQVAGCIVILATAVSRMWAGVHWFSDTYGAILWVAAAFAIGHAVRKPVGHAAGAAFGRIGRRP